VTDARVETVHEDRITAREFLAQAETLLADAGTRRLSTPAQSLLAHQASVCACDAILQAAGLRVTPGDGAHVVRIHAALDQLDGDTEDLLDDLDASRERRNEASYAAMPVAEASASEAREATAELIERARRFVG